MLQGPLDSYGKICILQAMNTLGQSMDCVVLMHRTISLHDSAPTIEMLVYPMNRYTANHITTCQHISMDTVAIHTLTAMFGQKSRMDI